MANASMTIAPESTAARVALWRALHALIDPKPPILVDEIGLRLLAPDEAWRQRPDMDPKASRRVRAAIAARARFIEDLVEEKFKQEGVNQYVILGAGLDTFAQRRPELAAKLQVFEVDQAGPQEWKKIRLAELGFAPPGWLHFVPVNFENHESWWDRLAEAGFDPAKPAVVVSAGVSMYLTREANRATLAQVAKLASGSTFAMTFILPTELMESEDRSGQEMTLKYAKLGGTPFLSLFSPDEALALAKEAGFKKSDVVLCGDLRKRYLAGRKDDLQTASGEGFLIAVT